MDNVFWIISMLVAVCIGLFIGMLVASMCAVSKMSDEEIEKIDAEMVGSMEDGGK